MNPHNPKRSRGVILTLEGWEKLYKRKLEWEYREKYGSKYMSPQKRVGNRGGYFL
jgi:hypothetical protein